MWPPRGLLQIPTDAMLELWVRCIGTAATRYWQEVYIKEFSGMMYMRTLGLSYNE